MLLCRMIKIEHSVFALPFAYSGSFLAAHGWPGFKVMLPLTIAMISIRTFAMTMNRIIDLKYDRANPRTKDRILVTKSIPLKDAKIFATGSVIVFLISTATINNLCLALAPIAIFLAWIYSYTKYATSLCHFTLGAVLGLAPYAGWLAVEPSFSIIPLQLFLGVLFWVAGFDIIYATQDSDFDKKYGINSIPACYGTKTSLAISSFCHINTIIFLFLVGISAGLSFPWYIGLSIMATILFYEHYIISPKDFSQVNTAFFTLNAYAGLVFFISVMAGIFTPSATTKVVYVSQEVIVKFASLLV